jgi:hypothetical protein
MTSYGYIVTEDQSDKNRITLQILFVFDIFVCDIFVCDILQCKHTCIITAQYLHRLKTHCLSSEYILYTFPIQSVSIQTIGNVKSIP